MVKHWQEKNLLIFLESNLAYAKLFSEVEQKQPVQAFPRVSLDSVQQALTWLWSELQLRTGREQKAARKVLGHERLRLQGGGALDSEFAQKFMATHGGSHPSTGKDNTDSISWVPDLTPLVHGIARRSDMARTASISPMCRSAAPKTPHWHVQVAGCQDTAEPSCCFEAASGPRPAAPGARLQRALPDASAGLHVLQSILICPPSCSKRNSHKHGAFRVCVVYL